MRDAAMIRPSAVLGASPTVPPIQVLGHLRARPSLAVALLDTSIHFALLRPARSQLTDRAQ